MAEDLRPLRERKAEEAVRESRIAQSLNGRKRELARRKAEKRQKKKSVAELLGMLQLDGIIGREIRSAQEYVPRSHNLDKQLTGLIQHMYVKYPIPAFAYQACLPAAEDDRFALMQSVYRQWFLTLAQGGSFPKLVRGIMTSKEAAVFLAAPATYRFHENVWWARMKTAGLPGSAIDFLIARLFQNQFFDDPDGRFAEVIRFFARFYAGMDRVTMGEITDFLAWKLANDPEFSLNGRTLGSVVRLTNEWRRLMQVAKLGQFVHWNGTGLPEWHYSHKKYQWEVIELLTNRDLLNEGRKQKHCVYSYVQWCGEGRSFIFSLRGYWREVTGYSNQDKPLYCRGDEFTRVTIELNANREAVQIRGLQNRPTSDEEREVLRRWAGETGIVLKA
jgi:hypothetical protein